MEWRTGVDEKLKEGVVKFEQLHIGQTTMLERLNGQDVVLKGIGDTLHAHILTTRKLTSDVAPLLEAVDTMKSGVRVLGHIGNGVAWMGRMTRRAVVWAAPFGALVATIYHFLHGGGKQ